MKCDQRQLCIMGRNIVGERKRTILSLRKKKMIIIELKGGLEILTYVMLLEEVVNRRQVLNDELA